MSWTGTGCWRNCSARDAIGRALAEAPGSGRYDSALNAKMTLVCVLVGCLFPGEGYDRVLARAFGMPGPAVLARDGPDGQRAVPGAGNGSGSTPCGACSRSARRRATRSSG